MFNVDLEFTSIELPHTAFPTTAISAKPPSQEPHLANQSIMAPVVLKKVDDDLKDVIQHLFEIQSAVHGYLGPETQQELVRKIKNLTLALSTLSKDTDLPPDHQADTTTDPSNPSLSSIQLPPEIIDYVDSARNPDIYTREFVELVQRGNQDLKGKREAFAGFRDVLAREMRSAMPECRGEVDRIVAASASASAGDQRDGAGQGQ
ncbi:Mediator complex subunit Med10 [Penicillium atrosanguineum]|uniref:Mediator complex subunit Med10 n=1 Tax=Penicillium atrosanguineum TaxID=1132637 RepID=UPI00238BF770|nr:Mediator complex subunit Med10 [Penicillium atrosanguineum]KAJ5122562.1 Mediator complex subunit Med10 [Penicillium atrosanguineum]KAJ5140286.1 Mediator complex subunit Med10 [Penicillium atrosanguineum]KAJ5310202.1 Mediator complex subunit Med10 [Penicillium atrosanguineum]